MIALLIKTLAPVLPWLAVLLVVFLLFAVVYLFVAFKNAPQKTSAAILLEIAALRKFRNIFTRKSDVVQTADGTVRPPRLSDTAMLDLASLPKPPEKP